MSNDATAEAAEDAAPPPEGLFDGDRGTLPADARWALTALLSGKALIADKSPHLWEALLTHRDVIISRMHDMYLDVTIDETVQAAFKTQVRPDGESYRVLARQDSYSREATALLLYLRETHFQSRQTGDGPVRVTDAQMRAAMSTFIPDGETDLTGRQRAMTDAIKEVVSQWVLRPVAGADDLYVISPVIEPLLDDAAIRRATEWMTRPADPAADDHVEGAS